MKQPLEMPMETQEKENANVGKETLLNEDDASKVNGGATTGASVNLSRHLPFQERA